MSTSPSLNKMSVFLIYGLSNILYQYYLLFNLHNHFLVFKGTVGSFFFKGLAAIDLNINLDTSCQNCYEPVGSLWL